MKRLIPTLLLTALLSAVLSVVPLSAPAHAAPGDTGFWVKKDDVAVLFDGCRYNQVKWWVPASINDNYDWDITATIIDPRGTEIDFLWISRSEGRSGTTSGSDGIHFCSGWDIPGSYRIRAELTYYDEYYNDSTDHAGDTFRVRKTRTRTILRASDTTVDRGQRVRFRVKSKREYPNGYFANGYARVILQRRTPSGWARMRAADTNQYGVAVIRGTWSHRTRVRVRALTRHTSEFAQSVSRPLVIY